MNNEIINKPWGAEEIIWRRDRFLFKIIHINRNEVTSWVYNEKRKVLLCIGDNACVFYQNEDIGVCLRLNDIIVVNADDKHRIQALEKDVTLVELSMSGRSSFDRESTASSF